MDKATLIEKFAQFLNSVANPTGEVDELRECEADENDFAVGEAYLIQTDTLWFFTGECVRVTPEHVAFTNVAWVQEMGRVSEFMAKDGGEAKYAEHFGARELRVAKKHIVFDVIIANPITETLPR